MKRYDIVVVGSGIAGLYAALLAAPHRRVLLITKGALEESNTRYAQGGIAAALAPHDSPELHLRDTIAAGDGLCEPEHVAILTHEAPDCILDLLRHGVPFDREEGDLAFTLEAAHSLPRVLHAGGDATGAGIEKTLAAAVREAGVAVQEHALCTSLLLAGGRVSGVRLLLTDGTEEDVSAAQVILASGGAGQLYARTTNPGVATGDGLAMAYRAGAELMDLEFFQFHPTALALDGVPSFLISEAVRGEGGVLRDEQGRAFMADYHPDRELAPRDVVARAIHTHMMQTSATHVWLDTTHLSAELVERRFPSIVRFCRAHGIDPVREPIPVAPAAHYLMGGVRTDAWSRTSLPGLFACGEVACTGVHGANRLASNSLLEGLVFARRAVQCIMRDGTTSAADLSPRGKRLAGTVRENGTPPAGRELAEMMWQQAGLVRSAESLRIPLTPQPPLPKFGRGGALDAAVSSRFSPIPQVGEGPGVRGKRKEYERANLALLSRLVIECALIREESRGAHFRSDFPRRDPAWQGHLVISSEGVWFSPLAREGRFQPAVGRPKPETEVRPTVARGSRP